MKKQERRVKILVLAGNNIFRRVYHWYSYLVPDPELILRCESYEDALKLLCSDDFDCFICDLQRIPEPTLAAIEELREKHARLRIAATVENDYVEAFQKELKELSMLDPQSYCGYRDTVNASGKSNMPLPRFPNYAMVNSKFASVHHTYHDAFKKITTEDDQMFQLFEYCTNISSSRQPVLITGETGTGKELFARAIHESSGRVGELVVVNIAGLDDTLLSDVLFGHVKGAFTGAVSDRCGLIERAANGTLFLDEVGEMSMACQVKLLRVLQYGEYFVLGDDKLRHSSARMILATHRDLRQMASENKFREDLFYRISTHHVQIPPLRARRDDLPAILKNLSAKICQEMDRPELVIGAETVRILNQYSFPGNIRELEAIIYDAIANCDRGVSELQAEHIGKFIRTGTRPESTGAEMQNYPDLASCIQHIDTLPELKDNDKILIAEAIRRANGNLSKAARMLGVSPQAIHSRVNR